MSSPTGSSSPTNEIKRPPGPPPNIALPSSLLKPPPASPPPRQLAPMFQRPLIESNESSSPPSPNEIKRPPGPPPDIGLSSLLKPPPASPPPRQAPPSFFQRPPVDSPTSSSLSSPFKPPPPLATPTFGVSASNTATLAADSKPFSPTLMAKSNAPGVKPGAIPMFAPPAVVTAMKAKDINEGVKMNTTNDDIVDKSIESSALDSDSKLPVKTESKVKKRRSKSNQRQRVLDADDDIEDNDTNNNNAISDDDEDNVNNDDENDNDTMNNSTSSKFPSTKKRFSTNAWGGSFKTPLPSQLEENDDHNRMDTKSTIQTNNSSSSSSSSSPTKSSPDREKTISEVSAITNSSKNRPTSSSPTHKIRKKSAFISNKNINNNNNNNNFNDVDEDAEEILSDGTNIQIIQDGNSNNNSNLIKNNFVDGTLDQATTNANAIALKKRDSISITQIEKESLVADSLATTNIATDTNTNTNTTTGNRTRNKSAFGDEMITPATSATTDTAATKSNDTNNNNNTNTTNNTITNTTALQMTSTAVTAMMETPRKLSDNNVTLSLHYPSATELGLSIDEIKHIQGRLTIKCIEGLELRPDSNQRDTFARANIRIDPWLRFRLVPRKANKAAECDNINSIINNHSHTTTITTAGTSSTSTVSGIDIDPKNAIGWKSTHMKRKQSTNPLFDDELIIFNITDMAYFIHQNHFPLHDDDDADDIEEIEDDYANTNTTTINSKQQQQQQQQRSGNHHHHHHHRKEEEEEDIILQIEVWISATLADVCIGKAAISLLKPIANPFQFHEENVPLRFPNEPIDNGQVNLQLVFERAVPGIYSIALSKLSNIRALNNPIKTIAKSMFSSSSSSGGAGGGTSYNLCLEFGVGPEYKIRSKIFHVTSNNGTTTTTTATRGSKGDKNNDKNLPIEYIFPENDDLILLNAKNDIWVYDMVVKLYDVSIVTNEKVLGEVMIDAIPYMNFQSISTEIESFLLYSNTTSNNSTNNTNTNTINQKKNDDKNKNKKKGILNIITPTTPTTTTITTEKSIAANLDMEIEFSPCGLLKFSLDSGKKFQLPPDIALIKDTYEYINIFLKFYLIGLSSTTERITKINKFQDSPNWGNEEMFEMEIVDEYILNVELFIITPADHEYSNDTTTNTTSLLQQNTTTTGATTTTTSTSSTKITSIGTGQISLLNIFKTGYESSWVPIKSMKPGGKGMTESGSIFIHFLFSGPIGIAYPQNQPITIPCYDERIRKQMTLDMLLQSVTMKKQSIKEKQKNDNDVNDDEDGSMILFSKTSLSSSPPFKNENNDFDNNNELQSLQQQQQQQPQEFSDDEIIAAFKFIDLDKNNFIGAKEIRHILICMGEMITDEEVDMMISMVDADGDGQVSFQEFRALVLHPRLGEDDVTSMILKKSLNNSSSSNSYSSNHLNMLHLNAINTNTNNNNSNSSNNMMISTSGSRQLQQQQQLQMVSKSPHAMNGSSNNSYDSVRNTNFTDHNRNNNSTNNSSTNNSGNNNNNNNNNNNGNSSSNSTNNNSNNTQTIVMSLEDLSKQRQKEMKLRERKKKAFQIFVRENDVHFVKVKLYYSLYYDLPKIRKMNGLIDFTDFIKCLIVEPLTEYLLLFQLFIDDNDKYIGNNNSNTNNNNTNTNNNNKKNTKNSSSSSASTSLSLSQSKTRSTITSHTNNNNDDDDDDDSTFNQHQHDIDNETGKIDFREFLLSLLNFIPDITKETRIRFCFAIYDEDKTGLMTIKEVEEILKGNHMVSLITVKRKAETIMKQASTSSSASAQMGSVTLNEFIIISKKFPNILIPTMGNNNNGQ